VVIEQIRSRLGASLKLEIPKGVLFPNDPLSMFDRLVSVTDKHTGLWIIGSLDGFIFLFSDYTNATTIRRKRQFMQGMAALVNCCGISDQENKADCHFKI